MASIGTQSGHPSSLQLQREANAVLAPDANGPGDLSGPSGWADRSQDTPAHAGGHGS